MKTKKGFKRLLLLLVIIASALFAGTNGKLAGRVKDQNGKPIPFANIVLEGTQIGTQADDNGKFYIINIPPGIYTVKCSQMGFQTLEVTDVIIKLDLTTVQDFVLNRGPAKIEGVKTIAERVKHVSMKSTTSGKTIHAMDDIAAVGDIEDLLAIQSGATVRNGELHVRGGRGNEVRYTVDGLAASDPVDGGPALRILEAVECTTLSKTPEIREKVRRTKKTWNTEEYNRIFENEFKDVTHSPLSTFSIDVDAASYSNMRRYINRDRFPPKDAIRIEELVNYFDYDYPQPLGEDPFSIITEYSD